MNTGYNSGPPAPPGSSQQHPHQLQQQQQQQQQHHQQQQQQQQQPPSISRLHPIPEGQIGLSGGRRTDSNYPQHPQSHLPPNYPSNNYPGFALPTLNFSSTSSPYNGPAYLHRQSYPPSSSPPAYDRYNSYNPGTGLPPNGPFINVSSPAPPRRRESLPSEGRVPPPARTDVPVETEPRMGQYMSYPQQPSQQTYEWSSLPAATSDNRGPPGSRRSTVSDHEGNAGTGPSGTEAPSEAGSRPNSPRKAPVFVPKVERLDEDDGEDEKIDHRKRKRNRTIRSCVPCHNHKRKCDRKRPCGRCTALGLTGTCVYEVDEVRDMNDPDVAESDRLRKRIAELEQVVRELRQRNPNRASNAPPALNSIPSYGTDVDDKGQDSKKRRVIVDRFARFKIDEAAMAAVADAAAAGQEGEGDSKLQIRPTSSGTAGPAIDAGRGKNDYRAEPYTTYLLPGEEMVYDRIGRKTFLGAAAGKSMLRRLRELTDTAGTSLGVSGDSDLLTVPEDAAFTGVFPDTRKTFPFTTIWSHENFSGEIIGLLPNKDQSEVLLGSWREEVCAFFLAWHVPTLESDFRRFFAMSTAERMNVPLSSLSLFLMICSLGCVVRASRAEIFGSPDSMGDGKLSPRDPKDLTSSRLQSELYLSGAYQALRLCSFMSNPSIHTIQAQIMINIYLLNSERAADAWSQTGSLVRQCIAMGLHVDPVSLDPKVSIRDAEVRRRIWWTVAGLDALLCLSFGRPSVINFYKTNLPQDREDETLSDAAGTANMTLPPSNVLNNETTEMTYHTAYFQLAIPSYELLDRLFHVDRKYSRSAIYGWFRPAPEAYAPKNLEDDEGHTYEGALRLARDITAWYSHLPRGMRFDVEEDTEEMMKNHSVRRINQILALCVKTFMIVMVLHRPYLRADPLAYPESADMCFKAAHMLLRAYTVGSRAKATIFWSWWTMSYRAFHAGAVCAFLAIRQPHTERAKQCLDAVKGAIDVLALRSVTWNSAHPVQGDLCSGLVKLHKLASTAIAQQKPASRPTSSSGGGGGHDRNRLSAHWAPGHPGHPSHIQIPPVSGFPPDFTYHPGTPLSQIRGFPDVRSPAPLSNPLGESARQPSPLLVPQPFQPPDALSLMGGDGFSGPESLALPQFWANMFGIKMEENQGPIAMPTGP